MNELDILIVGAGPSGMLLAAALHRHGVRFRIVDKDDGPTNLTRAPVLWQRTQEILAVLGLRSAWLPESVEMHEQSVHFFGKPSGQSPVAAPNSPYPKALYAGQDVSERLLNAHLLKVGHPVDYGKEAVAYEQDGAGATVTVRDAGGVEERIRAKWVVSAEGSKSIVRHATGLDFEGEKYIGYRIHIADVSARWTFATPPGQTFFFVEKQGYMGGQRMPGSADRFYFYILTPDETPDDDGNDLVLEDVERLVRQFSGDDQATLFDPLWLNTARYKHGLAETYRKGRAFLIGDAARSAPPLYGQGMNYAMHDAWNLAWKLAYVVKGFGPKALLDTFTDERRKLGADLDARIDSTFRFVTEPKPLQATLVKAIMPKLLSNERFQRSFDAGFTEIGLTYQGLGLSEKTSALGKLEAGARAPALWVKRLPECELANLLDLYDGTVWTLLVVAPAEPCTAASRALINYAKSRQDRFSDQLRAVLISQGPQRPHPLSFDTMVDAENRFTREHELPTNGLVLVRPDGYIAMTAKSGGKDLDTYLDLWLLPDPDYPSMRALAGVRHDQEVLSSSAA